MVAHHESGQWHKGFIDLFTPVIYMHDLQCFDAVGWAAGRASSMWKTESWGAGIVICLGRGADLHMTWLMPLPLIVSCFGKLQLGFTFLLLVHPGSPRQRTIKWVLLLLLVLIRTVMFSWYMCHCCLQKWMWLVKHEIMPCALQPIGTHWPFNWNNLSNFIRFVTKIQFCYS